MQPLPERTMHRLITAIVCSAMLLACGCAAWETTEPSIAKLPQTQMSHDSAGLQVATVTLDLQHAHLLDEILQELDEQVLDREQRRYLAQNGLRAGVLGSQLPEAISMLLMEAAERRQRPTAESLAEGFDQQRFMQCRSSKSYTIPVWPQAEQLALPHSEEVAGHETYQDAACSIEMRCTPQGNRGAAIRITPQIEHGALKQQYAVQSGAIHFEARRDHKRFKDLAMDLDLQPGHTLLVTCSPTIEDQSFGASFFRRITVDNGRRREAAGDIRAMLAAGEDNIPKLEDMGITTIKQKLFLVRLAQTQVVDPFAVESAQRLTTAED